MRTIPMNAITVSETAVEAVEIKDNAPGITYLSP